MTRVLVWQELFWPHIGGVEVLATKLLVALKQRGYDIVIVTRQDSPDLSSEANYEGIPVYRFPFWTVLAGGQLNQIIQLRAQVAKLKRFFAPDLVHINCFGRSALLHFETTNAYSSPLLLTLHTIHTPNMNVASLGRDALLGRTLRTANWVTFVSNAVFSCWRQLAPEISAYSSVVYNGLLPPAVRLEPLPYDPPLLLCLGRLHRDKGFDLALKAFASVIGHFPDTRLMIAGDGDERPFLERQAADMGLTDAVSFIGWVTPDKIFDLINAATVVVIPSRCDGLPTVALEAALMARPVVGTRVGGIPEIVIEHKTGLLADREDCHALAQAIEFLLVRPKLATQFGQAARTRVESLFNFERYVDAYDALYRNLSMGARGKSTAPGVAHE